MKTKHLQICTPVHALPATRSGCGAAEPLPWTCTFQKWDEKNVMPIGLWKWDTFKSQSRIWISQGKLMKGEVGVQFSQHSCHGGNASGSGVRANRVLEHCTIPRTSWPSPAVLSSPACAYDHAPSLDRRSLDVPQQLPSQSPTAYPPTQHQSHREDATLQNPPVSFPSSENRQRKKANKSWRDFVFL